MINPIEIRPFTGPSTADLYYDGEYVATMTENEFLQFRLDLVKSAAAQGMLQHGESGYTLKCLLDTEEPREGECIIYCDGNLSNYPYAFSYVRRTCREIYDINNPEYLCTSITH